MASSGKDEEMFIGGVMSSSSLASCSFKITSWGSRGLEREAEGDHLPLSL